MPGKEELYIPSCLRQDHVRTKVVRKKVRKEINHVVT